ncbi:MAG TPA: biotin--[acetyl-CoA-carboxylase] ligase [Actinomycetota bacterium]|nr:biotin--[acetyl-CoA-carboxylase] ligase [Actinomycetota bacterium]
MAGDLRSEGIEYSLLGRFGRPLQYFDEIDSTNRVALEWAAEGAPEGALVVADHQTAGRGRKARDWTSQPAKLLQFSLVLRPPVSVGRLGLLPTALGVACAQGIEEVTGLRPALKWPNDVTLGGRKVAGILVETRVTASKLDAAIAGLGINVGWSTDELPEDLESTATSLAIELERSGKENPSVSRTILLARVIAAFEQLYPMVVEEERKPGLVELASARSAILGQEVIVKWPEGNTVQGRATRLLTSGALEVVDSRGTSTVYAGEIEQIRSA